MGYLNLTLTRAEPADTAKNTHIIVREANVLDATTNELPAMLNGKLSLPTDFIPGQSAIVSPSEAIAAELRSAIPTNEALITVIPNPVDTVRLRGAAGSPRRVEGEGLRLVSAGRLTHQKGYDRLIELAPALPDGTRIDIFGNGPDCDSLNQRISSLGLSQRIVLHDFTDEIAAWMAGADAFVLPSRWEGLPNVVLESLALGTPVIASDQAAVSTLAAETESGAVVVAPVDRQFGEAISGLAANPNPLPLPRPSLLPERYQLAHVGAAWNELLAGVRSADIATPNAGRTVDPNVNGALTTKR